MTFLSRIILPCLTCFISSVLFAQHQTSSPGKSILQKVPDKGSVVKPAKPAFLKQTPDGKGSMKLQNSNVKSFSINRHSIPTERNCFTVESEKRLKEKFPMRLSTEAFERHLSTGLAKSRMGSTSETVYKIPTIVHIVHHGEPLGTGSNISQEQVMSQFEVLNEDFRRLGAGYNDHPSGADINIEFVPVLVDPQGKILEEPGIDRVFGYSSYYEYDPIEFELKPNTQWDPDRYFNIWVLNFGGSFSGYLGYAQFPSFSGLDGLPEDAAAQTDGVVIGYQYFGRTGNVAAPFDKGRTTTHEVGHWLGLRHIWGDGDCGVDDFCADTPNADGPNRSCDFRDSCPEEGPDMVENYMDYSTDGCMNIFTNDQKYRIRTVMDLSPRRNTLVACQMAPVAVTGSNLSDKPSTWFQYTATGNEVINISSIGLATVDTKLSVYRQCNTLPMNVSDNALGTLQSELSVSLLEGETIKFLWESAEMIEPFEWILTSNPEVPGAACELAATANEGINTVPLTTLNAYWTRFTSNEDHTKVLINSGGKEFRVYGNSCEQLTLLKSGSSSLTIYDLSLSESIYIAFDADGGNFNWSLTKETLRSGERCDDPVEAGVGENIIPHAAPFAYWYTYTIPYDGAITIKNGDQPEGPARLAVFKNCKGRSIAEANGTAVELAGIALKKGETVKILWDVESGSPGSFKWSLQSSAFENGEICSVAKPAQAGINHTDSAPQWFSFTTTKACNLKLSSVGLTEVNTQVIIKRNCNGPITNDNDDDIFSSQASQQSKLVLYGLSAGETVYILWSEKWSYEGFDWTLEEVVPMAGDNCANAKQAVIGTNRIKYQPDHDNFGNIFWTKFTVPVTGKKIVAHSSIPIDAAIYVNQNCETFAYVASEQGHVRAFDLSAGTEIVIIWDGLAITEDFTWELSVEDIVPGDRCTDPVRAVQGINTSQSTPFWYDYVMTQAGSIKLTYEGNENNVIPAVAILDGCGEDANIIFQNQNVAFVSGLNEGQHVYIYWTLGYPFPGATWSLQEIPQKKGDTCADPLPAIYGLNHAEYATQWFSYTAETTGNLKISSRAFTFSDTELYIYDACDGNLLAESHDIFSFEDYVLYFQSEALLENVEAGQTLLIKWAGNYSFEPFYWEITNDAPRPGDTCEDPLPAVEGVNNAMKPAPTWFTFTMPRTTSLTLSSLGYADTNTNVEIYDACNGNLLASNDDFGDSQSFVHIDQLDEGQTVLIRWANMFASEHYTFDWRLFVGGPDPGLVCQFPANAQVGINSTPAYVSTFYWYTFTMPEDNKKLVIKRSNASLNILRTVGVTGNCDRTLDYGIGEDEVSVTGLSAGEQVYIFWGELTSGERPGFDWELSVADLAAGDVCDNPTTVSPGLYHSTGATTWYQYSVPFKANLHISSVGLNDRYVNTYLEVYDACNGNLIASNDNPDDYSHTLAEVSLENIEAGQSFWIKWSTVLPFQVPFDWKLTVDNLQNRAPAIGDMTFQILSKPTNGQIVGTLVAEDPDGDVLNYMIKSGNNDGAFALDEVSGDLTVADASKLDGLIAARHLQVSVTDNFLTSQASVSIDIVTSVIDNEGNAIKAFPNPASEILQLDYPPHLKIFESYILDISGSLVKTNDPVAREISLLKLKQGIYFLNLKTDKGPFTVRIAVVK